MFCQYCGKQILADSIFCQFCGKRIIKEQTVPKEEENMPQLNNGFVLDNQNIQYFNSQNASPYVSQNDSPNVTQKVSPYISQNNAPYMLQNSTLNTSQNSSYDSTQNTPTDYPQNADTDYTQNNEAEDQFAVSNEEVETDKIYIDSTGSEAIRAEVTEAAEGAEAEKVEKAESAEAAEGTEGIEAKVDSINAEAIGVEAANAETIEEAIDIERTESITIDKEEIDADTNTTELKPVDTYTSESKTIDMGKVEPEIVNDTADRIEKRAEPLSNMGQGYYAQNNMYNTIPIQNMYNAAPISNMNYVSPNNYPIKGRKRIFAPGIVMNILLALTFFLPWYKISIAMASRGSYFTGIHINDKYYITPLNILKLVGQLRDFARFFGSDLPMELNLIYLILILPIFAFIAFILFLAKKEGAGRVFQFIASLTGIVFTVLGVVAVIRLQEEYGLYYSDNFFSLIAFGTYITLLICLLGIIFTFVGIGKSGGNIAPNYGMVNPNMNQIPTNANMYYGMPNSNMNNMSPNPNANYAAANSYPNVNISAPHGAVNTVPYVTTNSASNGNVKNTIPEGSINNTIPYGTVNNTTPAASTNHAMPHGFKSNVSVSGSAASGDLIKLFVFGLLTSIALFLTINTGLAYMANILDSYDGFIRYLFALTYSYSAPAAAWIVKFILQFILIMISTLLIGLTTKEQRLIDQRRILGYKLPFMIFLLLYSLVTVGFTLIMSLTRHDFNDFNGLENYKYIFRGLAFSDRALTSLVLAVILAAGMGLITFALYHSFKLIRNKAVLTIFCTLAVIPMAIPGYFLEKAFFMDFGLEPKIAYIVTTVIRLTGVIICALCFISLRKGQEYKADNQEIKKVFAHILPILYSVLPVYFLVNLIKEYGIRWSFSSVEMEILKSIPLYLILTLISALVGLILMLLLAYPLLEGGKSKYLYAYIMLLAYISYNDIIYEYLIYKFDLSSTIIPNLTSGALPVIGAIVIALILKGYKINEDNNMSSMDYFFKVYLPHGIKPALVITMINFALKWGSVNQSYSSEVQSPMELMYRRAFGAGPCAFVVSIIPVILALLTVLIVMLTTKRNKD